MSVLYVAKRQLRLASWMDLICILVWAALLFIFSVYHFGYLIPNNYSPVNGSSSGGGGSSSTSSSASGIISSKGYGSFFGIWKTNFLIFDFSLWTIVWVLFTATIVCFVGKILLGFAALYQFFKYKSIQHIYAALAVIFFPGFGGMIALNTYKATTSRFAPKYIAPHSSLRFKIRSLWNSLSESNTFNPEIKKIDRNV